MFSCLLPYLVTGTVTNSLTACAAGHRVIPVLSPRGGRGKTLPTLVITLAWCAGAHRHELLHLTMVTACSEGAGLWLRPQGNSA